MDDCWGVMKGLPNYNTYYPPQNNMMLEVAAAVGGGVRGDAF